MKISLKYAFLSVALTSFASQAFANKQNFSGIECFDVKVGSHLKIGYHDKLCVVVKWGDSGEAPSFVEKEGALKIRDQQRERDIQKTPVSVKGGSISIIGGQNIHVGNTIIVNTTYTKKGGVKPSGKSCSSLGTQDFSPNLLEIFLPEGGLAKGMKVNFSSGAYPCDIDERIMKNIQKTTFTSFSGSQRNVGEGEEVWTRFFGTNGRLKFSWNSFEPLALLSSAVGGVTIREVE